MSGRLDFRPGRFGIVITDLFVCATAALLIVLAVAGPTPPQYLPIQADLSARCLPAPAAQDVESNRTALFFDGLNNSAPGTGVPVKSFKEMKHVPSLVGLPPQLFYSIAVVRASDDPVSVECLGWIRRDLVRAHNKMLANQDRMENSPRPIFSVHIGYDHMMLVKVEE